MPILPDTLKRRLASATVIVLSASLVPLLQAAPPADPSLASQTALASLINRLAARGVLTKEDSVELALLAEADAADARAQAAAVQAAEARAAAAEARARAMAVLLARQTAAGTGPEPVIPAGETPRSAAHARQRLVAPAPVEEAGEEVVQAPAPLPVRRVVRPIAPEPVEEEPALVETAPVRRPAMRPAPVATSSGEEEVEADEDMENAEGEEAGADEPGDEIVRVAYVPEVVMQRLREEVKQDVLAEARREGWATPRAVPDWVTRLRLFGDVRFRFEGQRLGAGNAPLINFNAINTGAPFDLTGTLNFPYLNTDQDRNRLRIRARFGSAFDLGSGFTGGLRFASGENNSPVTQNQSLGAAGGGQGGNFSKYALWLDRAFLRYEVGGLPDEDLTLSFGRFDNPFLSTSMLWADDLGFDGLEAHGRYGLGEDITTFFALGAFPVFNTDLNFSTNRPDKFKSTDKWLYAAQLGAQFDLGEHTTVKLAAAYYPFSKVSGAFSTPYVPLLPTDAGDTDSLRPAFAQKGNTYMPLRDILRTPANDNGAKLQYQYYGLASKFRPLAIDARVEFNHFEPFQIALTGEYVKNLAFDAADIGLVAVNNLGPKPTPTSAQPFLGSGVGWLAGLTVGDAALQKRWDWNVTLGYRKVGSDALIDGFADSDFGGGGTNVKGLTFTGNLSLSSRVWLGLRWMSATQVAGDPLKNDIFQLDLNGKF